MKKSLHLILFIMLIRLITFSQIKSGPMLGAIDLRTAHIWCEAEFGSIISIQYWKSSDTSNKIKIEGTATNRFEFHIYDFYLTALEPSTTYDYQLITNENKIISGKSGKFTTQSLWSFRSQAPDFSFLTGSCAYFNESVYDRPGKPYGGDPSIFESMSKENTAFMLWLGDNWYYREADYGSEWGLWYRASRDRSTPELQNFLKSMSHYAIWDDHDYGPNNSNSSWIMKKEVRKLFDTYWCNPARDPEREANYTSFSYSDVDFFLMDDRSQRTSDEMKDSIDGKPNSLKVMWGSQQMNWLKNQLADSHAPFKIIVNGSPVLNGYNKYDCLVHYANEYNELIEFIKEQKVSGVLFFTGDRHHSEITGKKLSDSYTTYDIVSSSLTSGISRVTSYEKKNPDLMKSSVVEENNYTRVSVSGNTHSRKLKIEFMNVKGEKIKEWEINETQLKFAKHQE